MTRTFRQTTVVFAALCTAALAHAQTPPAKDDPRPVVSDAGFGTDKIAHANLPTLWIVGDSTVKSNAPLRGWGQEVGVFFDSAKINVVNRAIGGRSSRTFQTEGKWASVLAEMKAGDFVLIQFGHNDAGDWKDPRAKGRPSLRGEGDDTAEVVKPDGSHETLHSFGWYLRKYGTDAKSKGVTAIFCAMVPHKGWKDGKIVRGEHDTFVRWTADAARDTGALFVDLNTIIAVRYEQIGEAQVEKLFGDARTHTNADGAKLSAELVVAGLKGLGTADPLTPYFALSAQAIPAAK